MFSCNSQHRYKQGHASDHWQESSHCYALELETQRVWDYAGDGYVHRLIQSKTDGKLVEVPSPAPHTCTHGNQGQHHRHHRYEGSEQHSPWCYACTRIVSQAQRPQRNVSWTALLQLLLCVTCWLKICAVGEHGSTTDMTSLHVFVLCADTIGVDKAVHGSIGPRVAALAPQAAAAQHHLEI